MRSVITRLRRVPRSERAPSAAAFLGAIGVELGLRVLPFETLTRLAGVRLADGPGPAPVGCVELSAEEERLARCVDRALRVIGSGRCLRRALILGCMAKRRSPTIRIGVTRSSDGIRAHAWLEVDGLAFAEPTEHLGGFVPLSRAEC